MYRMTKRSLELAPRGVMRMEVVQASVGGQWPALKQSGNPTARRLLIPSPSNDNHNLGRHGNLTDPICRHHEAV